MPDEPKCTVCGAFYSAHTAGPCPWCGLSIEHHGLRGRSGGTTEGQPADCKAGKARMARARQLAGISLTSADDAALGAR